MKAEERFLRFLISNILQSVVHDAQNNMVKCTTSREGARKSGFF